MCKNRTRTIRLQMLTVKSSHRYNQSLQPTVCLAAKSRTLSALHNSVSGQTAAELISYGLKQSTKELAVLEP